jgi:hypothetical protein
VKRLLLDIATGCFKVVVDAYLSKRTREDSAARTTAKQAKCSHEGVLHWDSPTFCHYCPDCDLEW